MTIVSRLAKASERLAQEGEYFSHANGVGIACLNSLVKISARKPSCRAAQASDLEQQTDAPAEQRDIHVP